MKGSVLTQWRSAPPMSTSTWISGLVLLGLAPGIGLALATESWVIAAALGAIGFVPIIVRWPVVTTFGLYAFCVSSLDVFPLLPGGTTLTKLVGLVTAITLLGAGLVERRLASPPRAAILWAAFMGWATLSVVWAIDVDLTKQWLLKASTFVLLYLVTVSFKPSQKEIVAVCVLLVIAGALAGVLTYTVGAANLDADASVNVNNAARARLALGDMTSKNPNALGRMLLLPLAFAVAGFVHLTGTIKRLAIAGCIGLIAVGIYLSMSRSGIASMSVMLLVLVYRLRLRARRYAIVAVILLFGISMMMPATFFRRIESVTSGEDPTGSGRTEIWSVGLRAIPDFALVGGGLNNFDMVYRRYTAELTASTSLAGAHNAYLMVTLELGLVGLILMLGAIGSHFLVVRNARAAGNNGIILAAAEAAAAGTLVAAFFGDILWTKPFWLAWTILIWATTLRPKRTYSAEKLVHV